MRTASDDRIEQIFQQKLKDFESMPSENSWKQIQSKLPLKTTRIWGVLRPIIAGLLLISVVFQSAEIGEKHHFLLEKQKPPFTESFRLQPFDLTSPDSTHVSQRPTQLNVSETSSGKIQKPGSAHMGSFRDTVLSRTFNSKRLELDSVLHTQSDLDKHNKHQLNKATAMSVAQLRPVLKQISHERFDSLTGELTKVVPTEFADSTRQKRKQTLFSGFTVLKITTFYNSGVFTPLVADAVRVDKFSQSTSLLANRIGVALEVAYHKKLFDRVYMEYFAGYKVYSKELSYRTTRVEERTTEQTIHRITGLTHVLRTGVAIRPSFQPVAWSIAYEKAFGSFTEHTGDQLISVGLGVERKINSRVSLRPGISYGMSINGNIRHFSYKPIGLNLEVIWRPASK